MATGRANQSSGPDVWAIAAGWLALVIGAVTLNRWAWTRNIGDVWVLRGLILTFACLVTWVFGYWGQIWTGLKSWARRGGLNATVVTVGIIAAAIGINYLFHRYHWQTDLTKNKRFTLADQSIQVVKGLKEPVKAYAFFYTGSPNRRQAEQLLRQYADASDRFKYELVDPLENQTLPEQKKLTTEQGVVFEYQGRQQQTATVGEKEFTQALIKLTRAKQPKVYFLQGHGEMAYEMGMGAEEQTASITQIATALKDDNWQLEKLTLMGKEAKAPDPKDAAVIVVAGPRVPLMPEEEKRLKEYLDKGGRLLVLLSPGGPDLANVLKPYGIEPQKDYLYDPGFRQGLVVVTQFENHPINRRIALLALLNVRAVRAADKPPTGITAQALLKTSPTAIASPKPLTQLAPGQPGTSPGPFTVAALATKSGTAEARIIAIGTSISFSDAFLGSAYGQTARNGNFLTNCVNWLGDQSELVSIEPKDTTPKSLSVQEQHASLLAWIYWVEFPLLAVALGIYIYLKRR
jgi:ABC-type uncharacterized transport system involved in gliding motility auxiliary subunit